MGFSREVKLQWGVLWFLSSQQEAAAVGRPAVSKLIAQELPPGAKPRGITQVQPSGFESGRADRRATGSAGTWASWVRAQYAWLASPESEDDAPECCSSNNSHSWYRSGMGGIPIRTGPRVHGTWGKQCGTNNKS